MTIPATGGTLTLTIASDYVWEVVVRPDWLQYTVTEGKNGYGDAVVVLTAAGRRGNPRTGEVIVRSSGAKAGAIAHPFTITQTGALPDTAKSITGDSINFYPNAAAKLTTDALDGADGYKWYKGNDSVGCTSSPEFWATATGTYTVVGYNTLGNGAKAMANGREVEAITPLTDMLITVPPSISGDGTNDCASRDTLFKVGEYYNNLSAILKKNAVLLKVGKVAGAKQLDWYKGTSTTAIKTIDLTTLPANANWDSITSYLVNFTTDEGLHTYKVRATNDNPANDASDKSISEHTVALYACPAADTLNGTNGAVQFIGTWNASGGYTLSIDTAKVTKTSAELIIKSTFDVFDSIATLKAVIDLSHITIDAQLVLKDSKSKRDQDSIPAYIAADDPSKGAIVTANAGKAIHGYITTNGTLTITFEDAYLLYRGDANGKYLGHPNTGNAILRKPSGEVWTKQP
ncbi:hypothetical protein AGMMS4956_11850 [Bacteroidia bacterium]|nr:hypothetical protein AGMMS4956_11850 [Bacteroidia bacterium]